MGVEVSIEIKEGKELAKRFSDRSTVQGPLDKGIKRITLRYEKEVKKATPVDTGRLRASISHRYFPGGAAVGTYVEYASQVEYGNPTTGMAPRHVEGNQVRVKGIGMFAYAFIKLKEWAEQEGAEIADRIAEKLSHGH